MHHILGVTLSLAFIASIYGGDLTYTIIFGILGTLTLMQVIDWRPDDWP